MKRYAAFLRGVSPMNAKMPEVKRAFERAGFGNVVTVLSSGNVVFDAKPASRGALERKAEAAMAKHLAQGFPAIVRSIEELNALLEAEPFARFKLAKGSKRVVTFLRKAPDVELDLPIEFEKARILSVGESEVLSAYVPGPKGPVFMTLIEKTFGKEVTTRAWETVQKVARK